MLGATVQKCCILPKLIVACMCCNRELVLVGGGKGIELHAFIVASF